MTWLADLTIPGEPKSKQRPRVTRNGTFTPKTTRDYENAIRAVWDADARPDMPACVRLVIRFYLGTHRHVDVDNLSKSVKDALNGRAYKDDADVYELRAEKWHTSKERARTEVVVYAIENDREERA